MKLLVATHSALLRVNINVEEAYEDMMYGAGLPKIESFITEAAVVEDTHRYYGIAVDNRKTIWITRNSKDYEYPSQICNLNTGETLDFDIPLKDVHQITYANGGLYITNTYYNSVVYKSLVTGEEHAHTLGGAFEFDYAHPNSLWINGPYVYVMLHNKRARDSEIARLIHCPQRGFMSAAYRGELRYKLGYQGCHNLRFDGPLLTYVASENSLLAQLNHITGQPIRALPVAEAGNFLKGLVTYKELAFCGMSPNAVTEERYKVPSSLVMCNYKKPGLKFHMTLGNFGCVDELRILPEETEVT